MKKWIRRQFRRKARVYIMPTKMGGYLNGLIFLMFLLSIGYANNLLLIFTTFLFGFNLLWLIQTNFHLYRLKLSELSIPSGHAQSALSAQVFWKKAPKGPWNWELELESDAGDLKVKTLSDSELRSEGEITPLRRGLYHWQYLRVKSSNPFGLYRAWIYFPLNVKTIVYPALIQAGELPLSGKKLEGDLLQDKKGPEDFRGLASYDNDESRKISWKHYARSGELLVKEGEEKVTAVYDLELILPRDPELKEQYLSQVATQLVDCYRRDIPFTLKVNDEVLGQLTDCLKALALC